MGFESGVEFRYVNSELKPLDIYVFYRFHESLDQFITSKAKCLDTEWKGSYLLTREFTELSYYKFKEVGTILDKYPILDGLIDFSTDEPTKKGAKDFEAILLSLKGIGLDIDKEELPYAIGPIANFWGFLKYIFHSDFFLHNEGKGQLIYWRSY